MTRTEFIARIEAMGFKSVGHDEWQLRPRPDASRYCESIYVYDSDANYIAGWNGSDTGPWSVFPNLPFDVALSKMVRP